MECANKLIIRENKQNKEIVKSILSDLIDSNWEWEQSGKVISVKPPLQYSKDVIKQSMNNKRREMIYSSHEWIDKHSELLKDHLTTGEQAYNSSIEPYIEICTTRVQHSLFRVCRYYWSSPYSDYVGRRIKLLIRDRAVKNYPIIGIAAIGSPIIHMPERDEWVGWDKAKRTENIILCMDAYVLGAMPPYNMLLGGKLIAYILASNEVREIYKDKYDGKVTNISKRVSSDLVCLFTTSLYGRSSQYNRISYEGKILYNEIGKTKGYGTLHLSNKTFNLMQRFLEEEGIAISNKFGNGPNWRMRVIRTVCQLLGLDSDLLLKHSFKRNIYFVPLAENCKNVLHGNEDEPAYYDYPFEALVNHWKARWLEKRKVSLKESNMMNELISFNPKRFDLFD